MTTFEIGDTDFLLDGEPHRILSGTIHYFRVHPDQWRDRVRKARLMGLNTIETYIAWNAHEPVRGRWDQTGALDVGGFLDIVADEGMHAIVRPGPYICAEWHNGGLPVWLTRMRDVRPRSSDPRYLEPVVDYLRRVYDIVTPRQIDRDGTVVLVQIENEYGAYGSDFPTVDGRRVMVVAISPKQWRGLQAATGTTEAVEALADDLGLDFADEGDRFAAREGLGELFAPWFGARTLAEAAEALDGHGVCWGPYRTFRQLVDEDPRCSTANPLFSMLDQPGVGTHLVPGSPLAFGGPDAVDRGAATAPALGEHTEQVLGDDLGLSPAEVGALIDRGAVATA